MLYLHIFDILFSIEHVSGVVSVPKRIRPFADESCSNLLNRLSHLVTNAVRPTHQHLVHNAELSLRGAVKKNTGLFRSFSQQGWGGALLNPKTFVI